jgi:Ca2+-transporting ATPase
VLLELAIDPICALVFEGEPGAADAMERPPRKADEPLFGPRQIALALLQGGGMLAGVLGLYVWALANFPETQARGAAFLALVVGNLVLALTDAMSADGKLFDRHHWIYGVIAFAAAGVLAIVLAVPGVGSVFKVAAPSAVLLLVALAVALVSGGWFGIAKRLSRRTR